MAYIVLAAQALGLLVMIFICMLLWGDALKKKPAADMPAAGTKKTPVDDAVDEDHREAA